MRLGRTGRRFAEGVVALQIFAAGFDGTESIDIVIDNVVVATWDEIGGDALAGDFESFEVPLPGGVIPETVRLEFTNDNVNRDVRVDRIVIDGFDYHTESPGVFSTGTFTGAGCIPGFHRTEWLNCNGYFEYAPVDPSNATVLELSAAGVDGSELLNVVVGGVTKQSWGNVGGDANGQQFQTARMLLPGTINASDIRIEFVNDSAGRDLRVGGIVLDDVVYPTVAVNVFSTGTFTGAGCIPGFHKSEWLHCNGYFEYGRSINSELPGKIGGVSIGQDWMVTNSNQYFESPLLLIGPATLNDAEPGVVQVRNVLNNGQFETRFAEWSPIDPFHGVEDAGWLLVERGRFLTADGSVWETGSFDVSGNGGWSHFRFSRPFVSIPQVYATIQHVGGGEPLVVRVRNVDRNGFESAIFSEEDLVGIGSYPREVAFLALLPAAESGVAAIGGSAVSYQSTTVLPGVSSSLTRLDSEVSILASEEKSADAETSHAAEPTSILRLGDLLFAQDYQAVAADPFSFRQERIPAGIDLPPRFVLTQILPGSDLSDAVAIDVAEDGRVFVAEESGVVRVVENGVLLPEPFIDLGNEVYNAFADEGALSGFVLDPNFDSNGYFYLLYTTERNSQQFGRLARYTVFSTDPNKANFNSRRVLFGWGYTNGLKKDIFHNVGDIEFGNDGSLFFSWGDSAGNSATDPRQYRPQQENTAAGKIFRIHPATANGYTSNPFYDGNPRSVKSRTWAKGLRNGFRFEVYPESSPANGPGRLYIADVGRYEREEINTATGSENFGWPLFEGTLPYRPDGSQIQHTPPMVELDHTESSSIIGGVFYTGATWPAKYRKAFFAADFVDGWVTAWKPNSNHSAMTRYSFGTGMKGITDMKYDPQTDKIYLIGRGKDIIFSADTGLDGLYTLEYRPAGQ